MNAKGTHTLYLHPTEPYISRAYEYCIYKHYRIIGQIKYSLFSVISNFTCVLPSYLHLHMFFANKVTLQLQDILNYHTRMIHEINKLLIIYSSVNAPSVTNDFILCEIILFFHSELNSAINFPVVPVKVLYFYIVPTRI